MNAGLIPNQVLVTCQVQSGKQRLAYVLIMNCNLLLSFCLCELASVLIAHIFICFFSVESFTLVKSFALEYSVLLQVAEIFTFKRFISNFFVYVYNRFVVSTCVILLPEQISFHMCSLLFCSSDIHTP